MKTYLKPALEIVEFETEEVMTVSGGPLGGEDDNGGEDLGN